MLARGLNVWLFTEGTQEKQIRYRTELEEQNTNSKTDEKVREQQRQRDANNVYRKSNRCMLEPEI